MATANATDALRDAWRAARGGAIPGERGVAEVQLTRALCEQLAASAGGSVASGADSALRRAWRNSGGGWNQVRPVELVRALVEQLESSLAGFAPSSVEFLVGAASTSLSAERVVTDTTTVAWDLGTAGQAKANIPDGSLDLAKLANVDSDRLIGRDSAGSGVPELLTVGGGLEFTGSGGIQRSALTGDVTASAGSGTTTIANDAVTFAKMLNVTGPCLFGKATIGTGDGTTISIGSALTLGVGTITISSNGVTDAMLRDSSALSVIGRSANSSGDPADIAGANNEALRITSNTVNWGKITDNILSNMGSCSVKGRSANSSGTAGDISASSNDTVCRRTSDTVNFGQLTSGMFTASMVPASGTYTPTRSAEANLDANVTLTTANYLRVGTQVIVSGRFTANPTLTATATSFEMTLPIASNLGAAEDLNGTAFCGSVEGQGAEIVGSAANNTAVVQWVAGDVTDQTWSYVFMYEVI